MNLDPSILLYAVPPEYRSTVGRFWQQSPSTIAMSKDLPRFPGILTHLLILLLTALSFTVPYPYITLGIACLLFSFKIGSDLMAIYLYWKLNRVIDLYKDAIVETGKMTEIDLLGSTVTTNIVAAFLWNGVMPVIEQGSYLFLMVALLVNNLALPVAIAALSDLFILAFAYPWARKTTLECIRRFHERFVGEFGSPL